MRFSPLGKAAVAVGAGALALPFLGAAATAAGAGPAVVPGAQPAWATPAAAVGAPAGSSTVSFSVSVPARDSAGASAYAAAVSTPGSALFHRYLSPSAYNARFGPSSAATKKVSAYLQQQGFHVSSVADGNAWVTASGTVSQVQKAFGTTLKTYRYQGRTLRAPASAVHVPASIRSSVTGITGLDQGASLRHPFDRRPASTGPATKTSTYTPPAPSVCSTYWDQHSQTVPAAYSGKTSYPTYICGYTPDQLQTAYGTKSAAAQGRDGSGVTVAIIDAYASPTMKQDSNTYSRKTGGPVFTAGQYQEKTFKPFINQTECAGEAGWNGEETLDVEAVHGMASGANIRYVGAYDCDQGIDVALNYVVQHHTADIVSNSYGNAGEDIPAAEIAKEHAIFVQAAAEGISMNFSSGDSGDEVTVGNTASAQPDYPAVDPDVTAVGGTSLAVGADGSRQFETGWGTDLDQVNPKNGTYTEALPGTFRFGAGGGTSSIFSQPSYQKGVVPAGLSKAYSSTAMRVVPDVASNADPYTGFLIGETVGGTFQLSAIGGTSLACPTFAGVQALASQGQASPIGFANPVLYSLQRGKAFNDITPSATPIGVTNPSGSYLVTLDRDSTLGTAHGYDNVTGLGTPKGVGFLAAENAAVTGS